MKAIVVFHNHGCHWANRWLKPGFRHVFVAVQTGKYWVSIDGRAGVPVIEVICASDFDLAGFYRSDGFEVVGMERADQPSRWPIIYSNCVGLAKSVLGLRSWAVTPYQLYKDLTS